MRAAGTVSPTRGRISQGYDIDSAVIDARIEAELTGLKRQLITDTSSANVE